MKKLLLIPFCAFFTISPMVPDEFIGFVKASTKMIDKATGGDSIVKQAALVAAAGAGTYWFVNFWESPAGRVTWDYLKPENLLPKLFPNTWAEAGRILNPQPISNTAKQAIQVAECYVAGASIAVGIETIKNIKKQNRAVEALRKEQEAIEDARQEALIRKEIAQEKALVRLQYMNNVRKDFPMPKINII